jgi:hypothetical protein
MSHESALAVRADDRHRELASLLATGLLRWHRQRRLLEIRACPDSPPEGLEHVAQTALSVVNPVYSPETTTISEGECE